MIYHLSRIAISCSKLCNGRNVMAKSMKFVCTHIENLAKLTAMRMRWFGLLVCCLSCWGSWHLTFSSTFSSTSTSFSPYRNLLTLFCFSSSGSLTMMSYTCFLWQFSSVKSGASLLHPVSKVLTQNFHDWLEYLKSRRRVKREFC